MNSREVAETRRIQAIRCVAAEHPGIAAQALEEGWDESQTTRAVVAAIRAAGGVGPRPSTSRSDVVLEAGLCAAGGLQNLDAHFPADVLADAHRIYRGQLGMKQFAFAALEARGFSRGAFSHDFDEGLRAAFSTASIPDILSNVANKFLLESFNRVDNAWRSIAVIEQAEDFKPATRHRFTIGAEFDEVGTSGELKHATGGEESFTSQVKTFAKMLFVSRADFVNDDVGAFQQAAQLLGRGAALKLNDLFWKTFLDDAAFFSVTNKNLNTGAGSAFGIDGLSAAQLKFRNQVDANGYPLAIDYAIVLVPPPLEILAEGFRISKELQDTTANTKYGVHNPFFEKYRTVVTPYLSSAAITGSSATAWWLLGEPESMPTMAVSFLGGQESPTVESAEPDVDQLGIAFRGFHDFGITKREHRGGVKSTGV